MQISQKQLKIETQFQWNVHQLEIAYGESNGYVTDNIMWPGKVKVVPSCLGPLSQKWLWIQTQLQ